jgi:hypothetical protein
LGIKAMGDLAGLARMSPIIAGDDAGGHGHRAQLVRTDADDRMVSPLVEASPPFVHHGDEALDIHRQQP